MPAHGVLVIGESGSGKSSSIANLDPNSTFIINVSAKPLPFKGGRSKYKELSKENPKGNMYTTDNADKIVSTLQAISERRPEIKHVIIDDSQFVAANEYMRRVNDKGFEKFTSIASNMFKIPNCMRDLRDDLFVFFMSHAETITDVEGNYKNKAKTIGEVLAYIHLIAGIS